MPHLPGADAQALRPGDDPSPATARAHTTRTWAAPATRYHVYTMHDGNDQAADIRCAKGNPQQWWYTLNWLRKNKRNGGGGSACTEASVTSTCATTHRIGRAMSRPKIDPNWPERLRKEGLMNESSRSRRKKTCRRSHSVSGWRPTRSSPQSPNRPRASRCPRRRFLPPESAEQDDTVDDQEDDEPA